MKIESKAYRKDGTEVTGRIKPPLELQIELVRSLNANKKVVAKNEKVA